MSYNSTINKITIYKMHWYPELPEFANRGELHDFIYLFNQLAHAIKSKYPNTEIVELPYLENEIEVLGKKVWIPPSDMLVVVDEKIILLSFSDMCSSTQRILYEIANTENILIYCNYQSFLQTFADAPFKIKSSPYLPRFSCYNLDFYYELKKSIKPYDKFTFRGNYEGLPRNVIFSLREGEKYRTHFTEPVMLEPSKYYIENIRHKVGLSIAGVAEFCYRDVEYMGTGTPMLRFEYMANMEPAIIPNVHYISIPRIDNSTILERLCGEENLKNAFTGRNEYTDKYADLYYERFLEVKDDVEFLEFITQNARDYYEKYMHPYNRVKHFMNLMEL